MKPINKESESKINQWEAILYLYQIGQSIKPP